MLIGSTETAWGCPGDARLPSEEDLQYPPADSISFKGVITKITTYSDLSLGKPHAGFQLKLNITKVYQGVKLGDAISINYEGCHRLPGKQGGVINVLALPSKKGWYAPSRWDSSNNDPRRKREWYRWW
jgi:hypothetical protein